MKRYTLFIVAQLLALTGFAQKYTAEKSSVVFFSKAAIEDITATNTHSSSLLNAATGDLVFVIPIQDFEFEKSLMKDHFNEKYMETEKFPKATFQGSLTGLSLAASGQQSAKASGKLTIHGVTKAIDVTGTVEVVSGRILLKGKFPVKLADYNITIPTLLFNKIAEQVDVTVDFTYKTL